MKLLCLPARPFVVVSAAEGVEPCGPVRWHRDRCLGCRAAGARTLAGMRELRAGAVPVGAAPSDLEERILAAVEATTRLSPRRPWPAPIVTTGALAALGAAMATIGVVRRRVGAAP